MYVEGLTGGIDGARRAYSGSLREHPEPSVALEHRATMMPL
ncbi:MAG: hypothetical protein ACYDH5_06805 [Acidimicrobiales bacterium]